MITRWVCRGSVRGACGTRHRTLDAARRCCARDASAVKRYHGQGAYSDRYPHPHPHLEGCGWTMLGHAGPCTCLPEASL